MSVVYKVSHFSKKCKYSKKNDQMSVFVCASSLIITRDYNTSKKSLRQHLNIWDT